MASTPVFLPGKSHGQRSLEVYSLWGHKESNTTQRFSYHHHHVTKSLNALEIVFQKVFFLPCDSTCIHSYEDSQSSYQPTFLCTFTWIPLSYLRHFCRSDSHPGVVLAAHAAEANACTFPCILLQLFMLCGKDGAQHSVLIRYEHSVCSLPLSQELPVTPAHCFNSFRPTTIQNILPQW